RPADHPAVARELAEYLGFIGDTLDPEGLDHDITHWQEEDDGRSGVLLLVVDPAGEGGGTAAVRGREPGVGGLQRMLPPPACQGRGLGRRLLDTSVLEARSLGCRALRLDSQTKLAAAVHLYRVNGFQEIPPYNDNPRADIWMERAL